MAFFNQARKEARKDASETLNHAEIINIMMDMAHTQRALVTELRQISHSITVLATEIQSFTRQGR
jgi:hypothetical protein